MYKGKSKYQEVFFLMTQTLYTRNLVVYVHCNRSPLPNRSPPLFGQMYFTLFHANLMFVICYIFINNYKAMIILLGLIMEAS